LSNTRLFILEYCVVRLLDNWKILKLYFILAVVKDKLQCADILAMLNDLIKACCYF